MSTNDQQVAQALKRATEQVKELPDSPEARARTVAALEAMLKGALPVVAQPAPSRAPARLALAAAVALLLGAGLWFQAQRSAGVGLVLSSSGTLQPGHRIADGDVVDTGQAAMTLELPRGVKLQLQAETRVQLRDQGARVVVLRGEVAAEVISRDAPFFLEVGDTQVATRGARVSVKPGAGCDGHAQVSVTEGSAVINGGPSLRPGEDWPRCSPAAALIEPAREVVPEPVRPVVAKRSPPPPPLPATNEDRLARQNELYLQALTLQRAGDVNGAVKKLEVVLADEKSPLAETALAQKMRWLSATDRSAAREVAKDYLQRFPMGFGRADAETLVLEPH